MKKRILFAVGALLSLCASAASYTLDFSGCAAVGADGAPSVREASGMVEGLAFPSLASGDMLAVKFFSDATKTLTIGDELPGFGGARAFAAHLGDGVFSSLVVLRDDGAFIEVRDVSAGRLYRASVNGDAANVEEVDLSQVRRGGCIEVEADDVDAAQSAAPSKKSLVGAVPGNPFDDNVVAPAPVCVDIMLVFDNGAREWVEKSERYSSITNFAVAQVAKMNTVLRNTGLHTNFWYRLVDVTSVEGKWTTIDNNILPSIEAAMRTKSGVWAPVSERRDNCGADVVSLMIDTGSASGVTGIGYTTHGTTYEEWTSANTKRWSYSACAIRSVDFEYTLSHEVGHNMGLSHSPTLQGWEKKEDMFDYCYGYNFWGTNGVPYHTIMAYNYDTALPDGTYYEIPYFCSPDHEFMGVKLGTVESNDCTRALRQTCVGIADWRAKKILLPSDVTFSPSGDSTAAIRLSTLGGYEIRYTTDGSEPTRSSTPYTGHILLTSGSVTVKAVAVVDEHRLGAVAEKTYSAAVELSEYVILEDTAEDWWWGYWKRQDGTYINPTYWATSADKTAILDIGGRIAVDGAIDLANLLVGGDTPMEIVTSDKSLHATNFHVIGQSVLAGTNYSFDNWKLHEDSVLTLAPGEGKTTTLGKYLALGEAGSTLAISNGTLSVTKSANSGDGISTLQNCALQIDNGGILSLEPGWVLGYANTYPVTVNKGGMLKINKLESTHRPLILKGGNVDVNLSGRAYEIRAMNITVTDDSTIADKTANGGARLYLIDGDSTFDVSEGKTLTVDISTEKEKGIVKKGQGEARFQRELFHTGTNTISAGTFTIAYNSTTTNCANWIVSSGATLKIEDGKSLAVPSLELVRGAILDLPASSVAAPLAVSNSVNVAGVVIKLDGAGDLTQGASYPLITASGGFSGIVKVKKSALPELADGLGWQISKTGDTLYATVATATDAMPPISVVGVDDSLDAEIPDDAVSGGDSVKIVASPILVEDINDTAVAFTLDVEIPETTSETERTICSWAIPDNTNVHVVRCIQRSDGVLDIFYDGNNHAENITNSVALTSGRHTIKIGYNYGEYGGTWVFVDDAPAYWAQNLKWHEKAVTKLAIGATADATPQYPFAGLVLHGLGILKANSKMPLPNMTGTSGITYNYLIRNNSPTNSIPAIFPNAISGGFSMDNSLLDASLPESADSITVSIVASFPADKPGCLLGIWTRDTPNNSYITGQIDYGGDGAFAFSRNGYVNSGFYTLVNKPDANVEAPHLYTFKYTINEGFEFYQDDVLILTATWGFVDKGYTVSNRVDFGRGPWNKMTTAYDDNENPISGFKVYASHIELGSDDRSVSEAAVMESLNFDAAYDGMTIAEKLAYLPANQTADGVAAPAEIPEEDLDPAPPATPAVVDILVAYDNGAQAYVANKGVTLEKFAQEQIKKMNDVLVTNKLDRFYSYRLAGTCKVDANYPTVESVSGSLVSGAGPLVTLRSARELCGADTVTLLVRASGGATLGDSIPLSHSTDVASRHDCAFSVCSISAVDTGTQHTMIHENAHNMGCGHARQQSAINSPFEYGRGYYFMDGTTKRHTIMAYDVDGTGVYAHPSPYFSTTSKEFGFALGDKTNNNARVLKETCGEVAKWRTSVVPGARDIRAFDESGNEILSDCFFNGSLKVKVVAPVEGAELYYTFDGSEPTLDGATWHQTSPYTFTFTADRNLKIAYLVGDTLSPVRTIRFTKTGNVPTNGLWQTCLKYPWTLDGDTIRSYNQTDYTYPCATPLKATITGPKRMTFKHKSYFGGATLAGDNYSHFDVLLDDSPVLTQTECTNDWNEAYVDIPDGTHEVVFVFSQRFAMNNPTDYKDGDPKANDAVWLKDIELVDAPSTILNIPAGESVNLSDVAADITTITGEGTLVCDGELPDTKFGFTDPAWKGTIALKNLPANDATKDMQFELYGNKDSRIQLTNCTINYLKNNNAAFAGVLELAGDAAFSTANGYSDNFNVFGALEGSGSMTFTTGQAQAYVFGTATNFTGGINVGAAGVWVSQSNPNEMRGRKIVFGHVASTDDLPSHSNSASITLKSGAAAAIGGGAEWYAYNGINITGTLLVKGAGATLDCEENGATIGLKLNDGATIRFDAADASLEFKQKPVFTDGGVVTIAFGDGVVPAMKRQKLITWSEKPGGNFSLTGLNGWSLEVLDDGLDVVKTKPADRLDIGGDGAYIAHDEALESWMEDRGYNPEPEEWEEEITWQDFMMQKKADNGYSYWQCYVLGLDNTWLADDTLKANIEIKDGNVIVTTAENARELDGITLWTTLYGSETLVKPLPLIEKVKGTKIEMPSGASGFYQLEVSFEPED